MPNWEPSTPATMARRCYYGGAALSHRRGNGSKRHTHNQRADGYHGEVGRVKQKRRGRDKNLWLPYHLILERLPVRDRCRARCVCKAWNAMLRQENEAPNQSKEEGEKQEFWFVMVRAFCYEENQFEYECLAYSNQHKEKRGLSFRLPLPNRCHRKIWSLLGGRHCRHLAYENPEIEPSRRSWLPRKLPLASAGGIMSAVVRKPGVTLDDSQVIVFNCLTGSVKVLPPLLRHLKSYCTSFYIEMVVKDNSYHIILTDLYRNILPKSFQVFDSRIGCWKVVAGCRSAISSSGLKILDGDFFFIQWLSDTSTLLSAYHAIPDAWSGVIMPMKPCEYAGTLPAFAKYKGRLLVGFALFDTKVKPRRSFGFGVWELQLTPSPTWVELARTPQHLWPPHTKEAWDYDIASQGHLFYMISCVMPPLVFDYALQSWYFLPWDRCTKKLHCVLVHQPKFSAGHSLI